MINDSKSDFRNEIYLPVKNPRINFGFVIEQKSEQTDILPYRRMPSSLFNTQKIGKIQPLSRNFLEKIKITIIDYFFKSDNLNCIAKQIKFFD